MVAKPSLLLVASRAQWLPCAVLARTAPKPEGENIGSCSSRSSQFGNTAALISAGIAAEVAVLGGVHPAT
jgi:hypothetical protein